MSLPIVVPTHPRHVTDEQTRMRQNRSDPMQDGQSPTPTWINIGDTELAYVEQGRGTAIVFVHGGGGDWRNRPASAQVKPTQVQRRETA